ncbi:TRAP transporter small permease [Martelella lutilitoris]|uniref:TRAP transporter small permease protein n=1 Tax=Martelella lutilitoris TaxID=2583532 RepID=A0A7T7HJK6_9HYPH|nr:TRAP transporter small permease [Martelella lutilitoris]QQM30369.1 TRAP transporter small permease [Martelella lutilitoris]
MSDADLVSERAGAASPLARGLRIVLSITAGALLMALMGLTVIDVIGRYVLNAPIRGAAELSELLLVSLVYLGLPAVCLDGGHVTVDLVTKSLPRWSERARLFVTGLVSSGVLGIIAWRLYAYGAQVGGYNLVTNSLRLPVAPVVWFCAVFAGISALITLVLALAALFKRMK